MCVCVTMDIKVAMIVEMGFAEADAKRALAVCRGNVEAAVQKLLGS